jgi:hypothetical protein
MPLGRQAFEGHVRGMRAEDDPVPERPAAQRDWREKALESPIRHCPSLKALCLPWQKAHSGTCGEPYAMRQMAVAHRPTSGTNSQDE